MHPTTWLLRRSAGLAALVALAVGPGALAATVAPDAPTSDSQSGEAPQSGQMDAPLAPAIGPILDQLAGGLLAVDPDPDPGTDPIPEPAPEPDPTPDPEPAPGVDPTPEPGPGVDPTPGPTPEPEPTPDPVPAPVVPQVPSAPDQGDWSDSEGVTVAAPADYYSTPVLAETGASAATIALGIGALALIGGGGAAVAVSKRRNAHGGDE